jgi:hypothetical protein
MTTYLFIADEMDQADDELRETIRNIWPLQAKKMLDVLIPKNNGLYDFLLKHFIYAYIHLWSLYASKVTSSAIPKNCKYKYKGVYHLPAYIGLYIKIMQYVVCVMRAIEVVKKEIYYTCV